MTDEVATMVLLTLQQNADNIASITASLNKLADGLIDLQDRIIALEKGRKNK